VHVLSIFFAKSNVTSNVSSLVYRPFIISTSFITGTGFIKCIPIILLALSGIIPAIFVIEIEDVFEAKITSSAVSLFRCSKIVFFILKSSLAASITKSEFLRSLKASP
jgi:hypothetical protein